jgi:hypothetical protein
MPGSEPPAEPAAAEPPAGSEPPAAEAAAAAEPAPEPPESPAAAAPPEASADAPETPAAVEAAEPPPESPVADPPPSPPEDGPAPDAEAAAAEGGEAAAAEGGEAAAAEGGEAAAAEGGEAAAAEGGEAAAAEGGEAAAAEGGEAAAAEPEVAPDEPPPPPAAPVKQPSKIGGLNIDLDEDRPVRDQLKEILVENAVRVIDLFKEWDENGESTPRPACTSHHAHARFPLHLRTSECASRLWPPRLPARLSSASASAPLCPLPPRRRQGDQDGVPEGDGRAGARGAGGGGRRALRLV